jgi:pimeloyl-ACP methyl ester carboxylesterase
MPAAIHAPRWGTTLSHVWDLATLVQLTGVIVDKPASIDVTPADPEEFWKQSTVTSPRQVRVVREFDTFEGSAWRELELEGDSEGPGTHDGSRRLVGTAHVRRGAEAAPLLLIVHGYAVPFTGFDRWLGWRVRRRGVSTVRLDLPFHLRRTVPGKHSGDGYFSIDPPHTRAVVRQSVEDAAAIVAWARREVTTDIRLLGTSLGGLIALLLAAMVETDGVAGVAPLVDPATSFAMRPPRLMQHKLGMLGEGASYWGSDRHAARRVLEGALAPLRARNLTPVTAGDRVLLVRPAADLIVGPEPVDDLAAAWGAEVWPYPHGHVTVMNAPGLASRLIDRLTRPMETGEHLRLAG